MPRYTRFVEYRFGKQVRLFARRSKKSFRRWLRRTGRKG